MTDVATNSITETTERQQARAADPEASAWVSANAGTGKTYVLVQRILRLLLSGTPPQRILCLTFTKAAASEMSNRLFRRLSEWTIYNDQEANEHIGKILGRPPSQVECDRARRMFADALETPGGLKVQTIHAFCERLLHRFPLEAEIAPNFAVLDEAQESALRRQIIEQILKRASENDKSDLGHALKTITFFADEDRFISLIDSLLSKRIIFQEHFRKLENSNFGREELLQDIKQKLGISHSFDLPTLRDRLSRIVSLDDIKFAAGVLATGQKSDQNLARKFEELMNTPDPEARVAVIQKIFLTDKKQPRKRLVTNRIKEENETLVESLLRMQESVFDLIQEIDKLRLAQASTALIVVSKEISSAYRKIKLQRSALDFDDLIEKTSDLLSSSYASSWVLYKLDGGIDHILVDEAQDTNPIAWNIIDKLTDEFFSGESQSKDARTIFAVGDEKQSIYGFQGADPKKFAGMGETFKKKAEMALLDLHNIPLNQSFRSTYPVLHSVDTVFQDQRLLKAVTSHSET
ncbi:MAG: UvrD-helicase domain-containing protein, partial [Methyloligellaceae bacterium]